MAANKGGSNQVDLGPAASPTERVSVPSLSSAIANPPVSPDPQGAGIRFTRPISPRVLSLFNSLAETLITKLVRQGGSGKLVDKDVAERYAIQSETNRYLLEKRNAKAFIHLASECRVGLTCFTANFHIQDDFIDEWVQETNSSAECSVLKTISSEEERVLLQTTYVWNFSEELDWMGILDSVSSLYAILAETFRKRSRLKSVYRFLAKSGFRNIKSGFNDMQIDAPSAHDLSVLGGGVRVLEGAFRGEIKEESEEESKEESKDESDWEQLLRVLRSHPQRSQVPTSYLVIALVDAEDMVPTTRTFPIKFTNAPDCFCVEVLFSNSNAVVTLDREQISRAIELVSLVNEVLTTQMYRVDGSKRQVALVQRIHCIGESYKAFEEVLGATYNDIIVQYQWTSQAFYHLIASPEKSVKDCMEEIEHRNPSAPTDPAKAYYFSSPIEFQENWHWFIRAKKVVPALIPCDERDFDQVKLAVRVRKPQSSLPLVPQLIAAEADSEFLLSKAEEVIKSLRSQRLYASYDLFFIESHTPTLSILPVAPVPRSETEAATRSFRAMQEGTMKVSGKFHIEPLPISYNSQGVTDRKVESATCFTARHCGQRLRYLLCDWADWCQGTERAYIATTRNYDFVARDVGVSPFADELSQLRYYWVHDYDPATDVDLLALLRLLRRLHSLGLAHGFLGVRMISRSADGLQLVLPCLLPCYFPLVCSIVSAEVPVDPLLAPYCKYQVSPTLDRLQSADIWAFAYIATKYFLSALKSTEVVQVFNRGLANAGRPSLPELEEALLG